MKVHGVLDFPKKFNLVGKVYVGSLCLGISETGSVDTFEVDVGEVYWASTM
jgi:hypothetical protein